MLLLVVVELELAPAVIAVPFVTAIAVGEIEDDEEAEDDGLGHKLSYTYCCGAPLQVVVDAALYVPFG